MKKNKRKQERIEINRYGYDDASVYVTNAMSDFIIDNYLSVSHKKVANIKEAVQATLERSFPHVKVNFITETKFNPRMKYFLKYNRDVIFIANRMGRPSHPRYERAHEHYVSAIYPKDYALVNRKDLVSEISVPILYNMKIPFGYIQVNSAMPVGEESLAMVKKMAVVVEALLKKQSILPESDDRIAIADVSQGGMGLMFDLKRRKLVRYFKEGSLVYFDMVLPGDLRSNILASVRHVSIIENRAIRVSCMIQDIDALSEVHYQEFLESRGVQLLEQETA